MRKIWSHEANLKQGGGGSGKSTSVTQNYSPAEAAQRAQVQAEASRLYNQTASTIAGSPYTGAQVVPLSGDSITGQNLAKQSATNQINTINPQLQAATQFGLSDVMDVNSNPYLQASIDAAVRPITESYTDPNGVLSNIRTNSMLNGGQGTSSRQGIAEGIAAGRYANAIGDVSARVASEGYGQGLDTFSKTLGLTPGTMAAMNQPAQTFSAVGAQNEGIAQAQENYMADARNWDLNAAWAPLQNWANIVYGGTGANSSTTSTGGGAQRNPLLGAMGGALSGYQLGTMGGATFGPAGAIGGAILGGLFS
jgi:hypothetical protein